MLYRRFPGCRKRRSAHTTSHGRCQGAQRVAGPPPCRATFGTSRLPSLPLSRRRVLFAAVPTRPRWLRIGIRINQAGFVHSVRRRNQPSAVDTQGASVQDLIRSPAVQWAGGRTRCYTVRGLCISTLHVSLIIRVLPRAESATGCIFRQRRFCAGAIHVQGRYFRSIRRALRGSDGRAEVLRKESGKQVKHRTCRFFRSSLHSAGGDSRQFGKLAKTP